MRRASIKQKRQRQVRDGVGVAARGVQHGDLQRGARVEIDVDGVAAAGSHDAQIVRCGECRGVDHIDLGHEDLDSGIQLLRQDRGR